MPGPAHTRVVRRIAADPTSTALLLAGRTAVELWPGVRRVGEVGGLTLVETELPPAGHTTAATVRALPPERTRTSFVARFGWSGPALASTTGTLTLAYAPTADGQLLTCAALELDSDASDSDGPGAGALDPGRLRALAEGFLANLAAAAESRSRAA